MIAVVTSTRGTYYRIAYDIRKTKGIDIGHLKVFEESWNKV